MTDISIDGVLDNIPDDMDVDLPDIPDEIPEIPDDLAEEAQEAIDFVCEKLGELDLPGDAEFELPPICEAYDIA